MTRRVAAVDCGTNSLRLLLADVDPGRAELTDVIRRMEIVRLGQGVDQTGRLAPEALARTMAVLREYADVIARSARRRSGWWRPAPPGTRTTRPSSSAWSRRCSASRPRSSPVQTRGRAAVVHRGDRGTRRRARSRAVPGRRHRRRLDRVRARRGLLAWRWRYHLGQHRLRPDDRAPPAWRPAGGPGAAAAVADIERGPGGWQRPWRCRCGRPGRWSGWPGRLPRSRPSRWSSPPDDAPTRTTYARVAAADVHAVTRGLLAQTRAERAAIGVMHPGRGLCVSGGGALHPLDCLMRRFGFAEVLVSEHDILDGMAWSRAGDPHG